MADTTAPVPPAPDQGAAPQVPGEPAAGVAPAGPASGAPYPGSHPGGPYPGPYPGAYPGTYPGGGYAPAVAPRPPVRWWVPVTAVLAGFFLLGAGMAVGLGIGLAIGDRDGLSHSRTMDGRPGPMGDLPGGTWRDGDDDGPSGR